MQAVIAGNKFSKFSLSCVTLDDLSFSGSCQTSQALIEILLLFALVTQKCISMGLMLTFMLNFVNAVCFSCTALKPLLGLDHLC
jgi:hypothetical protein